MKEFIELTNIINTLLSPKGCKWDRQQKLVTLKKFLLEEVYELIEAIDNSDKINITEEIGDVLNVLMFITKKSKLSIKNILKAINKKLVSRHPHVFGNTKVKSVKNIIDNWQKIKQKEKKRKNPAEGIPKILPALMYAQKLSGILKNKNEDVRQMSGDVLGEELFKLVQIADNNQLNAEECLRKHNLKLAENI